MRAGLVVSPDARDRQRRASDPAASCWVSANAGAGKTKVLTDRVIRLMLAGSAPSRILCLTFTKAAAAEMTIRVFETLGDWVTLDGEALGRALEELTGETSTAAERARARRLFARAIETPGGLKIETIHAFCERLLHLVPFEAGVPPRFAVLDDAQAADLMTEARAAVLTDAASGEARFSALAQALDVVASEISGDGLTRLVAAAVADARIPDDPDDIAAAADRLAAALGLRPGESADDVCREIAEDGIPSAEWPSVAAALAETGKPADRTRADVLLLAARAPELRARITHYRAVFFNKEGEPRASVATKAVPSALRGRLEAERDRLVPLAPKLLSADAVGRSRALFTLAGAIRARFVRAKQRLAALDFGDLIAKTLEMLERDGAGWILYKLDRGIDHVLVDEAQDTNPEQWRILRKLTEEFTAGAGRPTTALRTVFAVGDPKQSIYSFQGADPRLFEDSRGHWTGRHRGAGLRFEEVRLDLSFRSAPAILGAVDHTFGVAAHFRGLSFDAAITGTAHTSARPKAAGHVEIWPTELPSPAEPDREAWSRPLDEADRSLPAVVAAARVARAVVAWTSLDDPARGRAWRPGEILILARKRGPAFFAVIRALKAAGVPVAGADRIDINEQIAVNDLVAAAGAALLPGNDLVLAAALKSPLVGLDDDDLVRIAADRPAGASVMAALETAAVAGDPRAAGAFATVSDWRRLAREHGPFGFFATLLGPGGGRRRLVERLGGEAADAIDVFLCRAAAEETGPEAPSLASFVARFEAAEHVVKRDPEAAGDQVRVMTVHGAKGLEAPLVVVLDGCDVLGPDPKLIAVPTGGNGDLVPVWSPGKDSDPPQVAAARIELRERGLEEHNRLLYVALTRARDRLVLVPFTNGTGREPEEAWCAMVRRGFEAATEALHRTEMPYGTADLFRQGGDPAIVDAALRAEPSLPAPDWLERQVPPEPEPLPPLRPSGPLGAADRPDAVRRAPEGRGAARRHGILVHGLVDHLAPVASPDRAARAARYLAARAGSLGGAERDRAAADALRVLDHPGLAALFAPGSRGEVAVAGRILHGGTEHAVSGQIDRLAIGPDGIVVAEVKTGSPPADGTVPAAYLAQLALYRALVAEMHPGLPIRTLLVWTGGPVVVEPDPATLDRVLADALAPAQPVEPGSRDQG